jgi:hypothetical protein
MEQPVVICFLRLKGLRASANAAGLELVYETEALALSIVNKWCTRSAEGRTARYDDPSCGSPVINDSAEAISLVLKERLCLSCTVLCRHFRIAKGTCLRILHNRLGMKDSISVGFPMPWTRIRRPKELRYYMEFFQYYRVFVLRVSRVS